MHRPQVRETAANAGVVLAGENALPVFSPSGVDSVALERIVYNTKVSLLALHPHTCLMLNHGRRNSPCAIELESVSDVGGVTGSPLIL